jgi:hypothetical protein
VEISEQKIIYSETGGHVLTQFFLKNGTKEDKEKQSMKDIVQSPIEEREGWSKGSSLSVDQRVNQSADGQPKDRPMEGRKR